MNDFLPNKNFGFGLMRLPKLQDGEIDVEQTKDMVDAFLAAGMTYFDTAYVYVGSEVAARKALVERHPRDTYTLASKINAMDASSEAEAKGQFEITLDRLGTDYLDFYLLHNLTRETAPQYERYHLWEYVRELRAAGRVRHMGFSFHDKSDFLEELLDAHPEVEFVQLQINYADWDSLVIESAKNLAVCQRRGLPVIVMEPIKGGSLANPPAAVASILADAGSSASMASLAVRFAASQPGVRVVLSGMSTLAQMEDNLSYMSDFKPLSEDEAAIIARAQAAIAEIDEIACTACSYCTKGCPMQIPIPSIFEAMNRYLVWDNLAAAKNKYDRDTAQEGKSLASACIQCAQCEAACPQHLPIIEYLQNVVEVLEA